MHITRRAGQSVYADGDAPVHPLDQRIQQEAGQPHARGQLLLYGLQLREDSQDHQDDASDGGRRD